MSYAATLATESSQYRTAAIQSLVNKSDPYNAITFYRNILAQLPPDVLEQAEKELPTPPKIERDFLQDPDFANETKEVWEYIRNYSYIVERFLAKYLIENMSRNKL